MVIVYPKGGAFDKKLRVLFGFVNAENLDFGSIWATRNNLLQQGKFWLCARMSIWKLKICVTAENCQKSVVKVQPPKKYFFFLKKSALPTKEFKKNTP